MVKNKRVIATKSLIYIVTDSTVANKFGYEQIKYLNKFDINVFLICGEGKLTSKFHDLDCIIHQIPYLKREISILNDFMVLISLIRLIRKLKPNLLVYSTPKASLLGSLAGLFCLVPNRVYQIWGARWQTLTGMKLFITKSMDKITILCSTNVIGVSKSIADLYNTFTSKRIDVLGLGSAVGVDPKLFYPSKGSVETLSLGFAGRIAKDKGIEDLLNIYELVKKRNPECTLQIIGDIDLDDPVPTNIIENISSDASITWIKHSDRKQLGKFMRNWQLQLFPSSREGLGNVIIEAGATGVPTICWDIVGAKDAMPDFCQKFLLPRNNIEQFVQEVCQYLDKPFTRRKSENLANWTIDHFNAHVVLNSFSIYVLKLFDSTEQRSQ